MPACEFWPFMIAGNIFNTKANIWPVSLMIAFCVISFHILAFILPRNCIVRYWRFKHYSSLRLTSTIAIHLNGAARLNIIENSTNLSYATWVPQVKGNCYCVTQ